MLAGDDPDHDNTKGTANMGQDSNIEWCDDTANFWRGCTKVSPGCANCYAETLTMNRMGGEGYRKGVPRIRHGENTFNAPLKWNKKPWVCDDCGQSYKLKDVACVCDTSRDHGMHRRRVFSLSLGDWLDDEVPIEWLADMLDVIRRCPNLDFLLLTKRPENWLPRMQAAAAHGRYDINSPSAYCAQWIMGDPPGNIWLGASVEDNAHRTRITDLLRIPANIHFLSIEPMLGPVTSIADYAEMQSGSLPNGDAHPIYSVDWVIVGGESGPKARPCDVDWIRSVVGQCREASIPCFVKQLGSKPYTAPDHNNGTGYEWSLKDRKGGDMAEWPEDLQVRQFPQDRGLA